MEIWYAQKTTMKPVIGIRREDKSPWERRVPITPQDASDLQADQGLAFIVQSSGIRVFQDEEYLAAGVDVQEDLSPASTIFAVKEIPLDFLEPGKTYVFFAHVIKGQPHNMPMLRRMMELGCSLIDYEKVTDEKGRRLIFFGRHAGLAGMIDTLWAFGQRLVWEGTANPFTKIQQTHRYQNLNQALDALNPVRQTIAVHGTPVAASPVVIGIAGYGNVSLGAQEVLNHLPVVEIAPDEVANVAAKPGDCRHAVYKTVFREEHMVEPIPPHQGFDLHDYYGHPEKYTSAFENYLPHLSILINAIYWDKMYPRLVTKAYVRRAYREKHPPRLKVIGDISCDIEGAVEVTLKATEPGDPVFVYDPETGEARNGFQGCGPVVMAVDILPTELPRESSVDFSRILKGYASAIATADFSVPLDQLNLPPEIKRAVILHHGKLTPDFRYLSGFLKPRVNSQAQEGKG
jgi:alpha-aminoadipic semialdehyde synthase